MVVVKRINNNAVLCVDSAGHQVVALGRGLASTLSTTPSMTLNRAMLSSCATSTLPIWR